MVALRIPNPLRVRSVLLACRCSGKSTLRHSRASATPQPDSSNKPAKNRLSFMLLPPSDPRSAVDLPLGGQRTHDIVQKLRRHRLGEGQVGARLIGPVQIPRLSEPAAGDQLPSVL